MPRRNMPDESGDFDLRIAIQPFLHEEVMRYGRDNGARFTGERYSITITHGLILMGRLPRINGINPAFTGNPGSLLRLRRVEVMRTNRITQAEADALALAIGYRELEGWGYVDREDELEGERRMRA
jgi:hypothetical protein